MAEIQRPLQAPEEDCQREELETVQEVDSPEEPLELPEAMKDIMEAAEEMAKLLERR